MLLDKVLCDAIPCICPLIDHACRPMKALEFLTLLLIEINRQQDAKILFARLIIAYQPIETRDKMFLKLF
jgi:hypothetical protein